MKEKNSLKQTSIFSSLKSWWYKLFHKFNANEKNIKDVENDKIKNEKEIHSKSIFEEYKEINERRTYLLDLQRKYKRKEILEENMSINDKIDLENLYIEQNTELKRKIRALDNKIAKSQK